MENSDAQDIVQKLLNLIERAASDNESLETEIQRLRDEVNRLKGEQGKPNIKPNKSTQTDISSEKERQKAEDDANTNENGEAEGKKKKRNPKSKLSKIKIDQTINCPLDKEGLPDDLISKGHTDVVVQDIISKATRPDTAARSIIHGLKIKVITVHYLRECEIKANRASGF